MSPLPTADPHNRRAVCLASMAVFVFAVAVAGSTVACPGLSWDEPAYRHSQVTLQNWFALLNEAGPEESRELWSADAIHHFWQYNRMGHNFHPPMAGYWNLATWAVLHHWWDDISARRFASVLQFAGAVAILCHFLGGRAGWKTGCFASLSLLSIPRLLGHSHVIGTDMPLMFFWAATAVAFYNGLQSRRWQWIAAFFWACLFLVKFSGAVIGAPFLLWIAISLCRQDRLAQWKRWVVTNLCLFVPLIPLAITLLFGARKNAGPALIQSLADWGMEHAGLMGWLFFWPLITLICFYLFERSRPLPRWSLGWEFFWVAAALVPLFCIAMNPTWWHDPVRSLASYFDLNLNRQGHLPDIGIFYLGQRYLYSLPPMNAYVLMAVTIPLGTLVLGLIGTLRVAGSFRNPLGWFLLMQMLTLPVFRMLPTPAHDGVRLFLPTFFFWAALAGLGAKWLVDQMRRVGPRWTLATGILLTGIGPVWALTQWVRVLPYELSYYNVGLPRAVDWGFEVTYWYDAVTPEVLDELNAKLPRNVTIGFPDRLINPETFFQLQELGRLRSDISFEVKPNHGNDDAPPGLAWTWLLTHSSKATAYTRLLYACKPWFESGHDGVRLFSVVDGKSGALALALHKWIVDVDRTSKLGPLVLNELAFQASGDQLLEATRLVTQHGDNAPRHLPPGEPLVGQLVMRFCDGQKLQKDVALLLQMEPTSLVRAAEIIRDRPQDLRTILAFPGYLRPEKFGGYFEPK